MSVIGNTFILASDDADENTYRYIDGRIIVYRNLTNTFNAIKKHFKDQVTFTVDVEDFIRKYSGRDFKPTKVGNLGDLEDIIVKCVYGEEH